jgi:hypothetical protein
MRLFLGVFLCVLPAAAQSIDLTRAAVVVRTGVVPPAEKTAAVVLVEEAEKRSGVRLPVVTEWPNGRPVIAITSVGAQNGWPGGTPEAPEAAEGFRLKTDGSGAQPVIWISARDARAVLYGVGHLLRQLEWGKGKLQLPATLDVATSPKSAIRGHQLGYRPTANSYDAWNVAQYEQYIRELALFGTNSIENIPSQDERQDPLMKVPRREMNRAMSEICRRYGLDYWLWTPASFDLDDQARRSAMLTQMEAMFRELPELTGVFVPGGDPGHNPPELVLPFLEDIAKRLTPVHPKAKVWLSLQGFSEERAEYVYLWLDRAKPDWFGGIVAGPSSPPIPATRRRLRADVRLRLYPDITHNKISQYEVPEFDQALALTLGREAINPRPAEYAAIHNRFAPMSDGFLSYSDGIHDDVNKTIFDALGWDPTRLPRDILVEYARLHFSPELAEEIADGIFALERNWRGPLDANGSVEGTLRLWRELERRTPGLAGNWRWQMCLLRAEFDAYVRRRLIQDRRLESEANAVLAQAGAVGSTSAIERASGVLNQAVSAPAGAELRERIIDLCERLFKSIGLQTSVKKYGASGAERGAVLDFIDQPLNNRWWLEDEFTKVRAMATEEARAARLKELADWENPGPGGFYDDIGHLARSPRVVMGDDEPLFWWWDQGKSRARLSWQVTMWPARVVYEGLDPRGEYVVRTTGYGKPLLLMDGERIEPTVDGREMHGFKEFPVPAHLVFAGTLVLTWDRAGDERHLNWRQRSRLAEVWLMKRGPRE